MKNRLRFAAAFPVVEVLVVLAAFPILSTIAQAIGFRSWELKHFGFRYLSDTTMYFLVPVAALALSRRGFRHCGFDTENLAYHLKIGGKAALVLAFICLLFPAMSFFRTGHDEWPGSIALTVAHLLGVGAFVIWAKKDPSDPSGSVDRLGVVKLAAFLALSFLLGWALLPVSETLASVVQCFVFVGFLQEILFRGYVQSRLNDVFGRPFNLGGVRFGPALVITALLFGHFHLLNSGAQYPWAVWTVASGLFFGYIREKTGSVIASGFAHGCMLLPVAIFSAS